MALFVSSSSKSQDDLTCKEQLEQSPNDEKLKTSCPQAVISISNLRFYYPFSNDSIALDIPSLEIPNAARVLLIGANGAGKSTLLSILAGKKYISQGHVKILNQDAYHDTTLSQKVSYLGNWWSSEYIHSIKVNEFFKDHLDSPRFKELIAILDIDLNWDIGCISDGQRRRVQLVAGLIIPKQVYLIDEATSDLDIIAREKLIRLLHVENLQKNATILYATHILDAMENWPTHILHLRSGCIISLQSIRDNQQYHQLVNGNCINPLYQLVRTWLYEDLRILKKLRNA